MNKHFKDEPSGEQHDRQHQFERMQISLARFLLNRKPCEPEPATLTDADRKALQKAGVMLHAEDLLASAQYALTLLGGLSTDQFAAGGDSPARDALLDAITEATNQPFNSRALRTRCAEDVTHAILVNQSKV